MEPGGADLRAAGAGGVLVVGAGLGAAYVQARRSSEQQATARVLAVAHTVAASPRCVAAVGRPDPTATLQPVAERVRIETGTDFVVVMSRDRQALHPPGPAPDRPAVHRPHPAAQQGGDVTESYRGTLGPSVRAVVPVERGHRSSRSSRSASAGPPSSAGGGGPAARPRPRRRPGRGPSGLGTWLVARRVRRQTHGLDAAQLQAMYDYYDAVLHAVREGLLLVDGAGRVRLVNDECRRLLDLDGGRRRPARAGARADPDAGSRPWSRAPRARTSCTSPRRGCWCSTRPGPAGRGATSAPW